LRWGEDGDFQVTNSLNLTLNSSMLHDKQKVTCTALHKLLKQENQKSCSITLRAPFPEGKPLVTVLEGTNLTLTCSENTSLPPANTTWRKGQNQDLIVSGSRYILSFEGPAVKLTIVNISKDDERYYFCRSENALGVLTPGLEYLWTCCSTLFLLLNSVIFVLFPQHHPRRTLEQ
ncbi:hypothetical protein XENOCAPTIV_010594, partial [Xenoophorus captivus]